MSDIIIFPCSLSLRILGSLRGSLDTVTYGLTVKLCEKINGFMPTARLLKGRAGDRVEVFSFFVFLFSVS